MNTPPSPPATIQIHYIPMHHHTSSRSLTDTNTDAGEAWKKLIRLLEGAEGVAGVWWAFQEDNEDVVGVFAHWKSLTAQRTWEASNPLPSIAALLAPILSSDYASFTSKRFTVLLPTTRTIQDALTALNAPITKVWTWWFPLDSFSPTLESSVATDFEGFVKANIRDEEGVVAHAGGWREEDDLMGERKARSFTGFIGVVRREAFNAGPPPFEGNIGGRIGLGMRTFMLGRHGDGGLEG